MEILCTGGESLSRDEAIEIINDFDTGDGRLNLVDLIDGMLKWR